MLAAASVQRKSRARTWGKALSFLLAGFTLRFHPGGVMRAVQTYRPQRSNRPSPNPVALGDQCKRGLQVEPAPVAAGARRVSAPSRPDSILSEAAVAKTAFLQAFERPVYLNQRVAGKGKLCREHRNQGRCEPGRRAVLEETKEPSDRTHSTLTAAFSQGPNGHVPTINSFLFNWLHCDLFFSVCLN
jgi:hypothetical protein